LLPVPFFPCSSRQQPRLTVGQVGFYFTQDPNSKTGVHISRWRGKYFHFDKTSIWEWIKSANHREISVTLSVLCVSVVLLFIFFHCSSLQRREKVVAQSSVHKHQKKSYFRITVGQTGFEPATLPTRRDALPR